MVSSGGKIVVISGPSGVGKSTICREVVKKLDKVYLSISATTRPKAPGEVEGRDYFFLTPEQFLEEVKAGNFIEYAKVFGHYYGTPKDKVEQAMAEGKTVILEIDVQGGEQIKRMYPNAKMIFILPPRQADLVRRINDRGRDNLPDVQKRLAVAGTEIAAAWQCYKHMVINDKLEQAVEEIVQIIKSPED